MASLAVIVTIQTSRSRAPGVGTASAVLGQNRARVAYAHRNQNLTLFRSSVSAKCPQSWPEHPTQHLLPTREVPGKAVMPSAINHAVYR